VHDQENARNVGRRAKDISHGNQDELTMGQACSFGTAGHH